MGNPGVTPTWSYKRFDVIEDDEGQWTILSVHPPHGKRRHAAYTINNVEDGRTYILDEPQLRQLNATLVVDSVEHIG
jgi:hypothetical protein